MTEYDEHAYIWRSFNSLRTQIPAISSYRRRQKGDRGRGQKYAGQNIEIPMPDFAHLLKLCFERTQSKRGYGFLIGMSKKYQALDRQGIHNAYFGEYGIRTLRKLAGINE